MQLFRISVIIMIFGRFAFSFRQFKQSLAQFTNTSYPTPIHLLKFIRWLIF